MKITWDRLPYAVSVLALFYGVYLILFRHRFPLAFHFLLPFGLEKRWQGEILFVCCCPLRQEAVGSRFCGLELLSFASERKREKTPIVDVLWFMPMQYSTKTEVAEILSDYQKSANKTRRMVTLHRPDLFPHTPAYDLFPCTVDI